MEVKLEKLAEYTPDPEHKINQLVTAATQIVSSSLGMLVTFAPGPSLCIFFGGMHQHQHPWRHRGSMVK